MCPDLTPPDDLTRWENATPQELVAHLVEAYHAPERAMLLRIVNLRVRAHGHPLVQAMRPHLEALHRDLTTHFAMEEGALFPALVKLRTDPRATRPMADPLRLAQEEHQAASELLDNLRHITADFAVPADAPAALRELLETLAALNDHLHRHLYLENHLLFRQE